MNSVHRTTKEQLRVRTVRIINLIIADTHVTPGDLEKLLGLSQGYISRLRLGSRVPSAGLVSLLVLLARDPEPRLQTLKNFWFESSKIRRRKPQKKAVEAKTDDYQKGMTAGLQTATRVLEELLEQGRPTIGAVRNVVDALRKVAPDKSQF